MNTNSLPVRLKPNSFGGPAVKTFLSDVCFAALGGAVLGVVWVAIEAAGVIPRQSTPLGPFLAAVAAGYTVTACRHRRGRST